MAKSKKNRPISILDVARESGVSATTVSLILNKGDQRISEPTRERVRNAIDKLGYRPNRLAQGLQNRRSNILAILVPQLTHTFADVYFGELISGIYDEASGQGYKILLEVASEKFIQKKRYLELYERCFIDGMLFLGSHKEHRFVNELRTHKRPFLLVNNLIEGMDCVACDYTQAGRLAAEHLVQQGHCQIGLIHGSLFVETARILKQSFIDTLATHGVTLHEEHAASGEYTEQGGAEVVEQLLKSIPGMTAVFAGNDKMAIGATQRLLAIGRRVPDDVSVIGCDDIHQARFVTPPLTTIRTPLYDMGRQCCTRMLELIRTRPTTTRHDILPVELVVRDSTVKISL